MILLHEVFHTIWPIVFGLIATPLGWLFEALGLIESLFDRFLESFLGQDSQATTTLLISLGSSEL